MLLYVLLLAYDMLTAPLYRKSYGDILAAAKVGAGPYVGMSSCGCQDELLPSMHATTFWRAGDET